MPDRLQLFGLPGCGGHVLEDELGGFRLPGPALPRDDDHLVAVLIPQGSPGRVRHGVPVHSTARCH